MAPQCFTYVSCNLALWLAAGSALGADPDRLGLFVIDIDSGKVAQVASEPLPGCAYCGSPDWSSDGKRLLLDATPGREWSKSHMVVTDFPGDEKREFADLGPGNCPTWSPNAKRISFLLNAGAVPEAQPGIWIMNADGTQRKRLADGNMPKWSPDGKRILSVTFSDPRALTLIDTETGDAQPVELAGYKFSSVPTWAGDGQTLVVVMRSTGMLSIALVDVADPARAKVKQVLWTRGTGVSDEPLYPVYASTLKRCVFVGRSAKGFALYLLDDKTGAAPTRLEPDFNDTRIAGLAISPDGRKVLFGSVRQPDKPPR